MPFPPACAKGRRTLSRAGQAGLWKSSWHRRCHQGSRLPARSALNGAHRAPAPPDEGSCVPVARAQDRPERKRRPLRKAFRRKPFLPSCVCRRRLRPQGRRSHLPVRSAQSVCHRQTAPPHPHKPFEKGLSENFTCLHPAFAEGPALAERKKAACPVRSRTPGLGIRKCTTMAQTRINTGVFIVVQVYKNKGKRTRTGHTCTPRQQWKAA